ncbi:MAG TPA: hypothetical protein VJ505_14005 [Holophagaceae bacterium]|nr:hypothetical protein [Holophagaceae bacterium]
MRPHLFILMACVLSLNAQDAWEALVHATRSRRLTAHPTWDFYRLRSAGRQALIAEEVFPARASSDLGRLSGSEEAFKALALRLGLHEVPTWALVDPDGHVRMQGTVDPTGKAVREAMEAGGWIPRWDRRQAFLKEHPGQGDAILDAIGEVERRFFLLRVIVEMQRPKKPDDPPPQWSLNQPDPLMVKALAAPMGLAEGVRPCHQAFEWFRSLPREDSERSAAWKDIYSIGFGGMASQESLVEAFQDLLRDVEDQLRRDPAQEALWRVWLDMAKILPRVDGEALVASLEPAPGTPWPTRNAANALTLAMTPQQRLDRAESELAGGGDPVARLKAWAGIKLGALLSLNREEDARLWILEARSRHPEAFKGDAPEQWLDERNPARAGILEALTAEPQTPHADPSPDLVWVVLGNPPWLTSFEFLERSPELDAWGRGWLMDPGELTLIHFVGKEELEVRTTLNLPPGPRWVLVRDSTEVLAQGTDAPDPKALAQALRRIRAPLLERLEAFIRTHPDHRQAREKRVEVLMARMPHPRLELKLAQACAQLGEALILRNPDFKPQRPLWEPLARRASVEADARLARWPESLPAWMAWMDWQSVFPKPASPTERLRGLAVWKSALRGGPGPLPLDVAAGVAQRLEAAGRTKELAEWGLFQWEGGWRQAMGWGAVGPEGEDPAEKDARERSRKDLLTLAQLTQRALSTLGRKAELQHFQEEWRAQDPAAGAGQGRAKP